MRHRLKGRKLGRTTPHRQAMSRNLVTSLFAYGRVITTVEKAKELRGLADRMITLGKKAAGAADPHAKLAYFRRILRTVSDRKVAYKIVQDIALRYEDRKGGYTRVLKLGGSRWDGDGHGKYAHNRLGDNGRKAIWELLVHKDREEEMKAAGRGRAAHEAEDAKRAEKRAKKQGK